MILKILEAITLRHHHKEILTIEEHRKLLRRRDRIRDFWIFSLSILWLILALNLSSANHNISSGRSFGVKALCASVSAIASEGRSVILQSNRAFSARFVHNLEQLGYIPPTYNTLHNAANAYVAGIANFLVKEVGHKGYKLVRANGTLNCKEFERFSKVGIASG